MSLFFSLCEHSGQSDVFKYAGSQSIKQTWDPSTTEALKGRWKIKEELRNTILAQHFFHLFLSHKHGRK